ncbi:MAG: VC_2705 family sodium/solute symporter [Alphaproteobacteria bacterium]
MSLNTVTPTVNPRLAASFGIFTSTFTSLVLVLIILEQLGLDQSWIYELIIILPVVFYVGIGVLVRTSNVEDFFISGQRVPPFYNGFTMSANVIGGAGLLSLIGAFFFIGYNVLAVAIGWCAGLGLMSAVFAPYLRKTGAFTLPGFFGIRFSSRVVRLIAALVLIPAVLMLLAAELRMGQTIASVFLPFPAEYLLQAGLGLIVLTVFFGGMRSLTWTQCVQFIVVILGISVPLIIISVMITNLPLPQLSYGGLLQEMPALESTRKLTGQGTLTLSEALPPVEPTALTRPFVEMFGAVGRWDFFALTFCIMLGTTVLPTQISRMSTSPNVSAVRRSFGWAALFVGFVVLTIPAYAAFTKFNVLQDLLGVPLTQIPPSGRKLEALGLITLSGSQIDPALGSAKVLFSRDAVALILPTISNFPQVLIGLAGAGAIAAILGAAASQLVALANVLSNDLYYPLFSRSASPSRRLLTARLAMIAIAVGIYFLATQPQLDPLRMTIWAFSICAGAFFVPLALAIWWRGLTMFGALAGMVTGLAVTGGYILFTLDGGYPWFGVDSLTAGVLGVPVSLLAAVTSSLLSPRPEPSTLEIVNEMHIPSGETIHTRLVRLAARGKAPKP